jgi:uncharacterized protein YpuA (DUF1002 family)
MNIDALAKEINNVVLSLNEMNTKFASISDDSSYSLQDDEALLFLKKASSWFEKIATNVDWNQFADEMREIHDDWDWAVKQVDASKIWIAMRSVRKSLDKLIEKLAELKQSEADIESRKIGGK